MFALPFGRLRFFFVGRGVGVMKWLRRLADRLAKLWFQWHWYPFAFPFYQHLKPLVLLKLA